MNKNIRKHHNDLKNIIDTAKSEAIKKRDIEIIINSIHAGLDDKTISTITGISIGKIK